MLCWRLHERCIPIQVFRSGKRASFVGLLVGRARVACGVLCVLLAKVSAINRRQPGINKNRVVPVNSPTGKYVHTLWYILSNVEESCCSVAKAFTEHVKQQQDTTYGPSWHFNFILIFNGMAVSFCCIWIIPTVRSNVCAMCIAVTWPLGAYAKHSEHPSSKMVRTMNIVVKSRYKYLTFGLNANAGWRHGQKYSSHIFHFVTFDGNIWWHFESIWANGQRMSEETKCEPRRKPKKNVSSILSRTINTLACLQGSTPLPRRHLANGHAWLNSEHPTDGLFLTRIRALLASHSRVHFTRKT